MEVELERQRAEALQATGGEDRSVLEQLAELKNLVVSEREKRRDTTEDVEKIEDKLRESMQIQNRYSHTMWQIIETQAREAEMRDQLIITVIKKRAVTMREFYSMWSEFQSKFVAEQAVTMVSSTGPAWHLMCKAPDCTKATQDKVRAWFDSKSRGDAIATFRGRSELSKVRERIVQAGKEAVTKTMGIEKGKGKAQEAGLTIYWLDREQRWQIRMKGKTMLAGRQNKDGMQYDVQVARGDIGTEKATLIANALGEFEANDRTGLLLRVNPIVVEAIGELDWGRKPRT